MQDAGDDWSIGRLARAAGLPVRTIRYYSDSGLLQASRTSTAHRRYGPQDVARLELIRGLRALDVDLAAIAKLLADDTELRQLLRRHAQALEVRLASLQRQLAVATAAAEAPPERTLVRLQAIAKIDAAERADLLDGFWNEVLGDQADTAQTPDAQWFRTAGTPLLPASPTGDQLDAWLELAALAADRGFRASARASAAFFRRHARHDLDQETWRRDLDAALLLARNAIADGTSPEDARAAAPARVYAHAYARAFGKRPTDAFRKWLSDELVALADPRAERWWQLCAVLQPVPASPRPPDAIAWLSQALSRHSDLGPR